MAKQYFQELLRDESISKRCYDFCPFIKPALRLQDLTLIVVNAFSLSGSLLYLLVNSGRGINHKLTIALLLHW